VKITDGTATVSVKSSRGESQPLAEYLLRRRDRTEALIRASGRKSGDLLKMEALIGDSGSLLRVRFL